MGIAPQQHRSYPSSLSRDGVLGVELEEHGADGLLLLDVEGERGVARRPRRGELRAVRLVRLDVERHLRRVRLVLVAGGRVLVLNLEGGISKLG